jgi:hypothetical protein
LIVFIARLPETNEASRQRSKSRCPLHWTKVGDSATRRSRSGPLLQRDRCMHYQAADAACLFEIAAACALSPNSSSPPVPGPSSTCSAARLRKKFRLLIQVVVGAPLRSLVAVFRNGLGAAGKSIQFPPRCGVRLFELWGAFALPRRRLCGSLS